MPRLLAPSISSTSSDRLRLISWQTGSSSRKSTLGSARAVEAFGEDAGDGGFAGAARADEQVGVGDPVLLDGVGQGLRDMLLPHHVG